MSIQFDIAKQIIAETCPNRKLKLEVGEYSPFCRYYSA